MKYVDQWCSVSPVLAVDDVVDLVPDVIDEAALMAGLLAHPPALGDECLPHLSSPLLVGSAGGAAVAGAG